MGILIYLLVINLIAYMAMYSDKKRAIAHRRRIPESRLFLLALIGGSLGSILGMHSFRHKTKHMSFKLGMPLIAVFQAAALFVLMFYYQAIR